MGVTKSKYSPLLLHRPVKGGIRINSIQLLLPYPNLSLQDKGKSQHSKCLGITALPLARVTVFQLHDPVADLNEKNIVG